MSALAPKADLFSIGANVRYVPQADMHSARLLSPHFADFRAKSPRVTVGVTPK